MIAILMTTYNRSRHFDRAAASVAALGAPTLVVDDGSFGVDAQMNADVCLLNGFDYLKLPSNRGLAAAINIGLSYLLADAAISWISYLQDDVDVHLKLLQAMSKLHGSAPLLTGHDAGEHAAIVEKKICGVGVLSKRAIRATHMHASTDFWKSVYPIPTREIGAPKRVGSGRGLGSNVDWWIERDAPNSIQRTGGEILCAPGLVRSFLWRGEDSCWNNTQKAGEEPPLTNSI